MTRSFTVLLFTLIIANCNRSDAQVYVIRNVNVISMKSDFLIKNQDVVIKDGKITSIKPRLSPWPSGAIIIEGNGKYLMPGLMDMHVHFSAEELPLYLFNGITTIRNLNGDTTHLDTRDKVNNGQLVGPRIFTSGPLITGPETRWKIKAVPTSTDDARRIVKEQKKKGYDFIKVYDGLSKDTYDAVMDEAHKQKIPAAGHIPKEVGLEGVLEKKQATIEHVEKIVYTYFNFEFDEAKIPKAVSMIKHAGTWVCPTLAVQEIFKLNSQGDFIGMLSNPEMAYVDKGTMGWWKKFATPKKESGGHGDLGVKFYEFQLKLTRALYNAGVPLIAGTDNPNPGMVPGFSLHEELRNMVAAGLSNYEALKTATVNGAIFLGLNHEIGTVEEGKVADLVLLGANPLDNISNTKVIEGIFIRGAWQTQKELSKEIEKIKSH